MAKLLWSNYSDECLTYQWDKFDAWADEEVKVITVTEMPDSYPTLAMSKGSTPRPVDREKYDENWETVFGKSKSHRCEKFVLVPGGDGQKRCYHCNELQDPNDVPV